MKLNKYNKILNLILPVITILVLLLIWLVGALIVNETIILPNPKDTVVKMFNLLGKGVFWQNLMGTALRSVVAFLVSFVLGSILAICVKFVKICEPVIKIIVSILRAMPTIAVILLLLLWTNSKVASVVVTMLVVLPTVFSSMQDALGNIDSDIIEMLKMYNLSKRDMFFKYILPIILPSTLRVIGSGLALNIKLIVASEVIAGTAKSIGNMMSEAKIYFETAELFAIVIFMIIISVTIELVFAKIAKRIGGKYESK
jgi:NitT/TauT family transport system permease protein